MIDCLDKKENITQLDVQIIVNRALLLYNQIDATAEDIGPHNISKKTYTMSHNLKAGKQNLNYF